MTEPAKSILNENVEVEKTISETRNGSADRNGHSRPDESAKELEKELQKLRETRRWEPQEGPFRGINSPPGRF